MFIIFWTDFWGDLLLNSTSPTSEKPSKTLVFPMVFEDFQMFSPFRFRSTNHKMFVDFGIENRSTKTSKNQQKSQSFFGLHVGREQILKSGPKWTPTWSQTRTNVVQDRQNCRKNQVEGPKSRSWDHLGFLEPVETRPRGNFWIFLAISPPQACEHSDRYIDIDI